LGRLPRRLVGSIATFAWYTGTGWVGVLLLRRLVDPTLAGLAPSIAVPWLPVGFGVAGLLYFGRGAWPAVFLGSLAVWGGIQGDDWRSVLPDAVGETLSILAIATLLRRWGFRPTLDRYQDSLLLLAALALGRLIAVGVDGINGIVMALLVADVGPTGAQVLRSTGIERTGGTLVVNLNLLGFMARWWANSVAGGVLAVPLVALLGADPSLRRRWRAGVPALALLVAVWIAGALAVSADAWRPALLGVALLIVALAATSFGPGIAAATTLVLAMVSATGFALRLGVFSGLSTTAQLEVAWGFLALLSGTGLFLTALLAQRERIRLEVAASVERYRQLFACNPFPLWAQDPLDGRIRLANPAALRAYGYTEAEFLALRGQDLRIAGEDGPPLSGRSSGARGVIERHRTAAGAEIDVEVTRMNLEFDDGTLQACFAEPLSERVELRLAALTAGDLERFRLGGDLRHRLNPILLRVSQSAEDFAAGVARGEPPDAARLALIMENVSAASALCRRLTRGASPLQGADGDLIAAIRQLPTSFADAGPEIQVSVQARAPVDLSIESRDHIYRLAEDAVRAAATRPGARNVRVSLDVSASHVRLLIEDDGDPVDLRNSAARLGLRSISSRAVAAQGQLQIGRGSAGGNAVTFECDQQGSGPAGAGAAAPPPIATARAPAAAAPIGAAVHQPPLPRSSRRPLLDALLLALACVASGAAGLWLITQPATVHASFDPGLALPWIANGIAVVGLLLRGERLWPAVFIASIAVWRGLAHDPWITVLFDAAGESLAAVVTVRLLRRFGFRLGFDRVRDIVVLAGAAAAGRTVVFLADALGINVAAMLTPLALTAGMREAFAPSTTLFGITRSALGAGSRWWLNGIAGVLLVVPAITPWSRRLWRELRGRAPELGAWLLALGATVMAILVVPQAGWRLPTLALGLVIVTWAAVRVGVTLAAVATLALSLAATTGFILRVGPLAPTDPGEGIGVLWSYIALLAATAQFLATALAEHNEVAHSLERLNRRYRALFDAVPHPVFGYTIADGRIRVANRASTLRYGYAGAEFARLTIADIDPEAHVPPPPGTLEPAKYTTRHRTKSGESFDAELAVTALDVDGAPGALCFVIDVSERNRLRSRMLEATDRERRHLARDLHDGLGQVLTGLQLGVSGLKRAVDRGEPVPPKNVAFVADAAREAQRTADRVLRGISPLQDTNGDLLDAIRGLADHLPPAYRHHLRVQVAAGAPVALSLELREHLYQIVRECVTNALKHARATEITVAVGVSADAIDVRVEDNGVGLDPATQSRGIGLESLNLRAGVLHGELAVGSRPGGGTVVRCRCAQAPGGG
jgi:PAS domain S-box-containing protein